MNQSFEKLKDLIVSQTNPFKVVVLTVTWFVDKTVYNSSFFHILSYSSIHQIRNLNVGPLFYGVDVFINKFLNYKVRHDLSKTNDIIETLSFEETNQKRKICIISGI